MVAAAGIARFSLGVTHAACPTDRPGAGEWLQTGLLAGNLAWTTLCLGGFLPQTMAVTCLLGGALLAVHLLCRAVRPQAPRLHPAGWWWLPFLGYAALNVWLVAPVPWLGWLDWLGWAQGILVFWVTLNLAHWRPVRTALLGTLLALAATGVALAGYQRGVDPSWLMLGRVQASQFATRASGCFGIPNSLAALLVLVLPVCGYQAWRHRTNRLRGPAWGALTGLLGYGLLLTVSRGGWLALGLALVAWPLLCSRQSRARRWGAAAGILLVGLAIGAALYLTQPHIRARLDDLRANAGERTRPIMWRGAWAIFGEHPAWGGGAGSYNVLFEQHRPETFQDNPRWAHNDYLNTLADYGGVGFLLSFGAIAGLIWRHRQTESRFLAAPATGDATPDEAGFRQALAIGLLAFALHLTVDFHLKIPALAQAVAIMGGLLLGRRPPPDTRPTCGAAPWIRRSGYGAAALAVGATVLGVIHPLYRAEALRLAAREAIDQLATREHTPADRSRVLARATPQLEAATRQAPSHGQAWADLAYALALQARETPARTAELGVRAEHAARQALACSPALPESWLRLGAALDMQGRWAEAGDAFTRAQALAPNSLPVCFLHAYHLALRQHTRPAARTLVDKCLRLDPNHRAAQVLRQHLTRP